MKLKKNRVSIKIEKKIANESSNSQLWGFRLLWLQFAVIGNEKINF